MSDSFKSLFELPPAYLSIDAGRKSPNRELFGYIYNKYHEFCLNDPAEYCIVVGDVTSTAACALAAKHANIKVAHVEGGIRSGDFTMPEEINRKIVDSIADLFFVTTELSKNNLLNEGVLEEKIHLVGNLMVDTLFFNLNEIVSRNYFPDLSGEKYTVLTMHRANNVRCKHTLIENLIKISRLSLLGPLIFIAHPFVFKTLKFLEFDSPYFSVECCSVNFGFNKSIKIVVTLESECHEIVVVEALQYLEFLSLVNAATLVVTDSGGLSEETTCMDIPCITLRGSTERPETVTHGTNVLSAIDDNILTLATKAFNREWKNSQAIPFWDGKSGKRIIEILNR